MKSSHEPSPDQVWQHLAGAKKLANAAAPQADTAAPYGFATRVVARWQAMSRAEKFQFWRRWSLRAAFAAVIGLGLVSLFSPTPEAIAAPAPISAPTISLPQP